MKRFFASVRDMARPAPCEQDWKDSRLPLPRTEAKKRFSVEDHVAATEGVECRKDAGVIDETPMAYKDIDAVMAAQADLVEVVHTLKQVLCVKG